MACGPTIRGSNFDLAATTDQIELRAMDPDGPVDQTFSLTATTRKVPAIRRFRACAT